MGIEGLARSGGLPLAQDIGDVLVVLGAHLLGAVDGRVGEALCRVRTDSAGSAKVFFAHIRALRERGLNLRFSVGYGVTEPVRRAIQAVPSRLWHPALEEDGTLRDGAEVAELTGMLDLTGYPAGTRIKELIAGLLADRCEVCGNKGDVEVRHVRALVDLAH
ncbi:hypothetical protein AB0B92_16445, partial [Streptomyces hygroscopicus]